MKKIFLIAILAVSLTANASTSNNEVKVNYRIENSFREAFNKAKDVKWTKVGSYVKALFVMQHEQVEAFFNYDGELIGTSRAISLEDLPTSAKRTFAKKYSGYNVNEVILFEGKDESAYFISAQKEQEKIILKVVGGGVSIYKPETPVM